jgi:hypothetical protein
MASESQAARRGFPWSPDKSTWRLSMVVVDVNVIAYDCSQKRKGTTSKRAEWRRDAETVNELRKAPSNTAGTNFHSWPSSCQIAINHPPPKSD